MYKLYDFKCPQCNLIFEEMIQNDDEDIMCPNCQCCQTERQISTPGCFRFQHGNQYDSKGAEFQFTKDKPRNWEWSKSKGFYPSRRPNDQNF